MWGVSYPVLRDALNRSRRRELGVTLQRLRLIQPSPPAGWRLASADMPILRNFEECVKNSYTISVAFAAFTGGKCSKGGRPGPYSMSSLSEPCGMGTRLRFPWSRPQPEGAVCAWCKLEHDPEAASTISERGNRFSEKIMSTTSESGVKGCIVLFLRPCPAEPRRLHSATGHRRRERRKIDGGSPPVIVEEAAPCAPSAARPGVLVSSQD